MRLAELYKLRRKMFGMHLYEYHMLTTFFKSHIFDNSNRKGDPWVTQRIRPRRNRKSANVRGMVRENIVTPK